MGQSHRAAPPISGGCPSSAQSCLGAGDAEKDEKTDGDESPSPRTAVLKFFGLRTLYPLKKQGPPRTRGFYLSVFTILEIQRNV